MGSGFVVVVLVVFAVLGIVAAIYGAKQEQERAAALAAMAAARGWMFSPEKDRTLHDRFRQFEVFQRGHSRVAFNTINGSMAVWDHPVVFQMGDYRYTITDGNGKSRSDRTYNLSYIIVLMPFAGVPDVTIRPEGFLDAIAGALGFDDIDFEDEEFSRKFHVSSPDRRFAYDLCHPRMIEYLKDVYSRGPAIVIAKGAMCFWSERKRLEPAEYAEQPERVASFLRMWPPHLIADLASRGQRGAPNP